jgi:hypothetical protein
MTTNDTVITDIKAGALALACPFCGATTGQPCRSRTTGREQERPHMRRIELTRPRQERPTEQALCCVCGNLRTWRGYTRNGVSGEWDSISGSWHRCTGEMKCFECGQITMHALLRSGSFRDFGEDLQRVALGGAPTDMTDAVRLRTEYRQGKLPRNPKLRHMWWSTVVDKAIADGNPRISALCGELIDTPSPDNRGETSIGFQAPREISATEYEDPETGLWWLDMDCVDCLRASNADEAMRQRRQLEHLLLTLSVHPKKIPDHQVANVLEYLERFNGDGNRSD